VVGHPWIGHGLLQHPVDQLRALVLVGGVDDLLPRRQRVPGPVEVLGGRRPLRHETGGTAAVREFLGVGGGPVDQVRGQAHGISVGAVGAGWIVQVGTLNAYRCMVAGNAIAFACSAATLFLLPPVAPGPVTDGSDGAPCGTVPTSC
jgi:hypothetical protein